MGRRSGTLACAARSAVREGQAHNLTSLYVLIRWRRTRPLAGTARSAVRKGSPYGLPFLMRSLLQYFYADSFGILFLVFRAALSRDPVRCQPKTKGKDPGGALSLRFNRRNGRARSRCQTNGATRYPHGCRRCCDGLRCWTNSATAGCGYLVFTVFLADQPE